MLRFLPFLTIPLKIWMFIDAVRRRADTYWFWCIAFVPFGEVIYFFSVKRHDMDMRLAQRKLMDSVKRPPSVAELRHQFDTCPSLENRLLLAQGLYDAEQLEEAREHFEVVLERNPQNRPALYGLGVIRLDQRDYAPAAELLERLVDLQASYRDYAAWPELAEALYRSERIDECHALLEDLVRTSPRLAHSVVQAQYLKRSDRDADAAKVLRGAIKDDEHAPKYVRRQNRGSMRRAKTLLAELAV